MEQRIKKCVCPTDVKIEALNRKEVSAVSFFRDYSSYFNCVSFVFAHVEQSQVKTVRYFYYLEKDIM